MRMMCKIIQFCVCSVRMIEEIHAMNTHTYYVTLSPKSLTKGMDRLKRII